MTTQEEFIKNQARCISHEIRNQLSICDVYCEIIKKHLEKNSVSIPSVDNALSCIQKSAKMIGNSLLDLKSLSNYEFKNLDLNYLILQSIELSKVYIQEKNIQIDFISDVNVQVNVDENKFLASMLNLIKNAIEAIELEGWIKITTEIIDSSAFIYISNNGEKIPEDFASKIFESGLTTKSYGSGLGLYICKNNFNSMNADLTLLKSDEITEFLVKIPVNKS